jgi:hypothetical protein
MSFKPIDNCSLKDILQLFEIEDLTQEELKRAKKKVLMLHPDKNIGRDTSAYFEYFRKAYYKLEEIYKFLKTDTKQSTEYLSNDFTTETQKAFHKYYLDKGLEKDPTKFSKFFNETFENIKVKDDTGYGDWLKGDEGIYDKNNLEKSRQKAMQIIQKKDQDVVCFSDIDSQYSDLKEAHVNSVITMDVNQVYQNKEKYNTIEEFQRSRAKDTQNLNLLDKTDEHERMLNNTRKTEKMESMNMAYQFMKETDQASNKFKEYCSKFLFIKN